MKEEDFNKGNDDFNNNADIFYKPRFNINDLNDKYNEDEKEKNDIEKVNLENEKLNEDSTPNQIENKIYQVDYNTNKKLMGITEKNKEEN